MAGSQSRNHNAHFLVTSRIHDLMWQCTTLNIRQHSSAHLTVFIGELMSADASALPRVFPPKPQNLQL
jgi:hypothetical protein